MYVIGRNVEIKIEDGKLTIICQIEGVGIPVSRSAKNVTIAATRGTARIPNTDLRLQLNLYSRRPSFWQR